ncbi:MAG TPA: DUF3047 domain-containing protein [Nevskiaceae bacterium]|nr:DUF3047 domain-containing protein [Nevskiaceae bacterium]
MPLRNAPSNLPTTLRFMASRVLKRASVDGTAAGIIFRARVERVVDRLKREIVECRFVTVRSTRDWSATGIDLPEHADVTIMADGMVHLSRAFDVGFFPKVGLWYRIGDGEVGKIVGGGSTVWTERAGSLQFLTKPPGEFLDRRGTLDPQLPRDALSGAFEVAVIHWRVPPAQGLAAAAAVDADLFNPVLQRLKQPVEPPKGWHYLWRLGDGEIFRSTGAAGHGELCCHTSSDVGILQHPIDHPLTADSQLSWSWCVEQLPSAISEHIQPTHDYLSIAIEFDNGLDLTYMWSTSMPVGTVFQCPLPWWDQRETHWVVRSGRADLGKWLDEKRPILADYEVAIGGTPPKKAVAVWLIANTCFQRGEGKCRYRAIAVEDGDRRSVVST